jgi:hypothetical protein
LEIVFLTLQAAAEPGVASHLRLHTGLTLTSAFTMGLNVVAQWFVSRIASFPTLMNAGAP